MIYFTTNQNKHHFLSYYSKIYLYPPSEHKGLLINVKVVFLEP